MIGAAIRSPAAQYGATLVLALVMLLAMTLIAVTMIDSVALQALIAANSRQKMVSRYAAEAALSAAEKAILAKGFSIKANMAPLFDRNMKGYYSAVNLLLQSGASKKAVPVNFDIADASVWDDATHSIAVAGVIDSAISAKAPRYIIEYMGQQQGAVQAPQSTPRNGKNPPLSTYFFRIVAIGWGKEPRIYTILQSSYQLIATQTAKGAEIHKSGRISWSIIH